MKPKWWVENTVFDNEEEFKIAITDSGYELIQGRYIPFGGSNYEFLPKDETVIFYGSINVIKDLQRQKIPIYLWCNFKELTCRSYYAYWGEFLVQRNYGFYPLAEIKRLKEQLFFQYGDSVFIRPDNNDKAFHGEVVHKSNFERWAKNADFYDPEPSCLCVVSSKEPIIDEWRFVIINRKVITGSHYKRPGYPQDAATFAEKVANSTVWQPDEAYCMDIALTHDRDYRLLEIGSVNCAGFYKCDFKKIIDGLSNLIREQ